MRINVNSFRSSIQNTEHKISSIDDIINEANFFLETLQDIREELSNIKQAKSTYIGNGNKAEDYHNDVIESLDSLNKLCFETFNSINHKGEAYDEYSYTTDGIEEEEGF